MSRARKRKLGKSADTADFRDDHCADPSLFVDDLHVL